MRETRCAQCRQLFVKKYRQQRFCSLLCSNRFNLNNKNSVSLPRKSADLAELFGILLGDGGIAHYFVKIYLNRIADKEYARYVFALCKGLFPGAGISSYDRPARGTVEIQISSRDVVRHLAKLGLTEDRHAVPAWIESRPSYANAALRGLFDTEGCVGFKFVDGKRGKRMYKQLTFTNKNGRLLKFVESRLSDLGYSPTKRSRKNIYISNQRDLERFMREIGLHNPKLTNKLASTVIDGYTYGRVLRMVRN